MLPLFPVVAAVSLFTAFAPSAQAMLVGSISFSDRDRQEHARNVDAIVREAAECLQQDLARHQSFHRKYGISPFYGSNSTYGKAGPEGRRAYLENLGFKGKKLEEIMDNMDSTSCVGMAMKCLERGFNRAGESDKWNKIHSFVGANGTTGNSLQLALRELGWQVLYFNPDTSKNQQWDAQEQRDYPDNQKAKYIWGMHEQRWNIVKGSRKYIYNKVDDITSLVNFGTRTPSFMKSVPFFLGTAHGGYHVFPGFYGTVIEAHSTRRLTDPLTIETSPFNPIAAWGGPRGGARGSGPASDGGYRSGLIAIPPGYHNLESSVNTPDYDIPAVTDSGERSVNPIQGGGAVEPAAPEQRKKKKKSIGNFFKDLF
jgi:hypothetical protein